MDGPSGEEITAKLSRYSFAEDQTAVYRRQSIVRSGSAPLQLSSKARPDSDASTSNPVDIVSRYAIDSPKRPSSSVRRSISAQASRHGSTQDLLDAATSRALTATPEGREAHSTASSYNSALDDLPRRRSSTTHPTSELGHGRPPSSRRGSMSSSRSHRLQRPVIPVRSNSTRPPSASTLSSTVALSPSAASLSDNPSRSSIATSDEGGSSPIEMMHKPMRNDSLEVLSASIPIPQPSPTEYGLGITADRAIMATPTPSEDTPVFLTPVESPLEELRQIGGPPRPESRQRSTSAGAERARWSGIGGPRWAARQNSQPPSSLAEENERRAVSWNGQGELAALDVPAGTTELLIGGSNDSVSVLSLLSRALPLVGSPLRTLDLSRSGLIAIPALHLDRCTSLTHLDLSGNSLTSLTDVPLPSTLRSLIVDNCQLSTLPLAWSQLGQLRTLCVRNNALRSLPGWLARLSELEELKIDGNPFHGVWTDLVRPFNATKPMYSALSSRRGSSTSAASSMATSSAATSAKLSPTFDLSSIKRMKSAGDLRSRTRAMPVSPSVEELRPATAMVSTGLTPSPTSAASWEPPSEPASEPQRKTNKSFIKKSLNRLKTASSSSSVAPTPPPKDSPPASDYSTVQSRRGSWMRSRAQSSHSSKNEVEELSPEVSYNDSIATDEDAVVSPLPPSKEALRTLMAYLRDLDDLSQESTSSTPAARSIHRVPSSAALARRHPSSNGTSAAQSYYSSRPESGNTSDTPASTRSSSMSGSSALASLRIRDDPTKRSKAVQELVVTEQTYVRGLQELIDIYVAPAALSTGGDRGESIVPLSERKAAFGNVSDILAFHATVFLPDLERASRVEPVQRPDGQIDAESIDAASRAQAQSLARVFIKHSAFLRMYSSYITNFDNALEHVRAWSASSSESPAATHSLSSAQRKRIKTFVKQCRNDPRHRAINCEALLLLPVQRIPRYKVRRVTRCCSPTQMLLELLIAFTPLEGTDPPVADPTLVAAYDLAAALALEMNERKRESESRLKLLAWQQRIGTGRFKSPLIQPHRTLLKEGSLLLKRVVKRSTVYAESAAIASQPSLISVPRLDVESTAQRMVALLCSDILVLAIDSGIPHGPVDLFTVLRLNTNVGRVMTASVFGTDGMLRLIDSRAIVYLQAESLAEAENWCSTINAQLSV